MSAMNVDVFFPVRRSLYKVRVGLSIHKANLSVYQAFGAGKNLVARRIGVLAGVSAGVFFVFSIISYAVTNPPDMTVTKAPRLAKAVVTEKKKPAPKVETPIGVVPDSLENTVAEPEAPAVTPDMIKTEVEADTVAPVVAPLSPPEQEVIQDTINIAALPKPEYPLPAPDNNSLYTLVVDKVRREVLVLQETKENFIIVDRFPASIGAQRGDKQVRGDLKTPEGLYRVVEVKNDEQLPSEYGPRAYVLNYPNELDRKLGKTGDGIWIHGSGLGEKTKDTKGCVEINDSNIVKIGKYISVGAPVYIFPEGFEAPVHNNSIQKNIVTPNTLYGLKEWIARAGESSPVGVSRVASASGG